MALDLVKQADAMYVDALHKVASDADAVSAMSPVAKVCIDAGVKALEKVGTGVIETVSAAVAEKATVILGPEVMAAVTGVANIAAEAVASVADIMPGIGAILGVVQVLQGQADAFNESHYAVRCTQSIGVPVIGSGPMGQPTLANIFAPSTSYPAWDPLLTAEQVAKAKALYDAQPRNRLPLSSLGRAFVAVTETDDDPSQTNSDTVFDDPLYHAAIVYDGVARTEFIKDLINGGRAGDVAGQAKVGVPPERRKQFAVLRKAIGSQSKASVTLQPIYLDMFAREWLDGHLTSDWCLYLMGHYFRSANLYGDYGDLGWVSNAPHGSNTLGDGSPADYCGLTGWSSMVDQMADMMNKWIQTRGTIPLHPGAMPVFKINFGLEVALRLLSARNWGYILNHTPQYTSACRMALANYALDRQHRISAAKSHMAAEKAAKAKKG